MENPNLKTPKFSVIMLIYNRTEQLRDMAIKCMESVHANSQDYELIIVDNASTVRHDWENHCDTYVRLNKNYGCSGGWNAGLRVARGKYKVVIGDDTQVSKGWLEGMAECFKESDCGVSNPYVEHLPIGIGIKHDYKWFSGACFMVTQETLDKVGYFRGDLYYPTDSEDRDYWVRVYQSGLKCYKNFSVKIRHLEGQTSSASDLGGQSRGKNAEIFKQEWGFDSNEVFCGDKDIYDALILKTPKD